MIKAHRVSIHIQRGEMIPFVHRIFVDFTFRILLYVTHCPDFINIPLIFHILRGKISLPREKISQWRYDNSIGYSIQRGELRLLSMHNHDKCAGQRDVSSGIDVRLFYVRRELYGGRKN